MVSIKTALVLLPVWTIIFGTATAQHFPISGIHTGVNNRTGARPVRRNINEFQNDVPTWSLYIQALIALQQTPEDDQFSWFQISGIHGRPWYDWDNVHRNPNSSETGYCTHYSSLFPMWHRPYVALFEQVLAGHVQSIAKAYKSGQYQEAADIFRVPYWDWATDPRMPDVVNQDTVLITTPAGQANVSNPLLLYQFQQFPLNATWFPADYSGDGIINTYPTTLRTPYNGTSTPESANDNLGGSNLKQNTYSVFNVTNYNEMATSFDQTTAFEYVHNQVHHAIGGFSPVNPGHMSTFSYSAFDPIFYLHHANTDRLIAMWQAMNPTSFMTPDVETEGSYTVAIGENITENTPLGPFFMLDGKTPWTTKSARYIKDFGYSYPELQDWLLNLNSTEKFAANVSAQVLKMYSPGP
ncbi:Di-copper centre-containing protein [Hyaloscypha variabilis]